MAERTASDQLKAQVLAIVSAVPEGRVATYRDIGAWLGVQARQVAHQLGRLTPAEADTVPWHRAVGDEGWLGAPKGDSAGRSQEDRLAGEGVALAEGRVRDFAAVRTDVAELDHRVAQAPAGGVEVQ